MLVARRSPRLFVARLPARTAIVTLQWDRVVFERAVGGPRRPVNDASRLGVQTLTPHVRFPPRPRAFTVCRLSIDVGTENPAAAQALLGESRAAV